VARTNLQREKTRRVSFGGSSELADLAARREAPVGSERKTCVMRRGSSDTDGASVAELISVGLVAAACRVARPDTHPHVAVFPSAFGGTTESKTGLHG